MLEAFATIRNRFPSALLVIVPRHPERFEEVARFCVGHGYRIARRSRRGLATAVDILIGDTMGEMIRYLAMGDVAFVAGSLVPVGGHNVLEPAALSLPVIFGPHMFNFRVPAGELLDAGAGWQIKDAGELAGVATTLFADESLRTQAGAAARAAVARNRGALDRLSLELYRIIEASGDR